MTFHEFSDGERTWFKIMLTKNEMNMIKLNKEQANILNDITPESSVSERLSKLTVIAKLIEKIA